MTTDRDKGAGTDRHGMLRDFRAAAPVLWLCASLLLSLRGLWQGWATSFDYDLPPEVIAYVQAGMAAGAVQILLGLYVLGLAWRGSPRFAGWFTAWAVLAIVVDVALQGATLFIDAFVPTLLPWLVAAASIAISLWTILLVRRRSAVVPGATVPQGVAAEAPAPILVVILNALLGLVLGGAAGLGLGLVAGSVIVDWLEVSCFEGGCGYAAAAIGLLGLVAGAIGGLVFAVLRSRGRRRPAA